MTSLEGRVAVVTGAAGAIGIAIVRRLAELGATGVMVDRDPGVKELADQQGWSAEVVDLGRGAEVEALAARVLERHARCDVLVNNAGIHLQTPDGQIIGTDATSNEVWDATLAVNLTAPFALCRAFLPGMVAAGRGRIVNIASRAGRAYSLGSSAAYSASKAGLIGLTRTIAGEYARHGITANTVAPGRTETPLLLSQTESVQVAGLREIPRGQIGKPNDIAAAVAFLATDAASNLVGAVLDVNGGTYMP
jgi:3-oxoacyl-[acyl-carrier protein] reductase